MFLKLRSCLYAAKDGCGKTPRVNSSFERMRTFCRRNCLNLALSGRYERTRGTFTLYSFALYHSCVNLFGHAQRVSTANQWWLHSVDLFQERKEYNNRQ